MDATFLRRAIELAQSTQPHPNPRVGAVITDAEGRILGEGWHLGPGSDHAEVMALNQAGSKAQGASIFVTLEPCAHHGRTPPCSEALIEAGISRVVIAAGDPDSRVAGRGIEQLRVAGIDVVVEALPSEGQALDPGYFHHRKTGRPRVTIKAAATLDGNTAARDLSSQWITSAEARLDAHRLRAESDAVMIGAGTLLADNPRLDVRLDGYTGRQPRPVVVAGARVLPPNRRLWEKDTIVLTSRAFDAPAEVITVAGDEHGQVDLSEALLTLGSLGIVDLLVEGGAGLLGNLLRAGLVDRGVFYLGARLGGGTGIPIAGGPFVTLAEATDVSIVDVRSVGPDVRIEFIREGD